MEEEKKKTVVLYPGLAVSHFVPMMKLADVLVERGYAVSVALIDPAVCGAGGPAFAAAVARAVASSSSGSSSRPSSSIRFHTLPGFQDPPVMTMDAEFLVGYLELVRRYSDRLRDFLLCCCSSTRVHAVVVDSLSGQSLAVARELGIPGYVLFTSNAAALAVFAQLPLLHGEARTNFKELGDTPLEFNGVPPLPASHLIEQMLEDPESDAYKVTMESLHPTPAADGILINTFESLEARAVGALTDPLRLPGRVLPPVYCIGPFVSSTGDAEEERHECLAWLDGQPDGSVVFLCFGSTGMADHPEEQLREIAAGLEKSGHRFLWVVRVPVGGASDDDLDLDALLPDGFLERTTGRGLVVKLWAPQVDVLRHKATGAFVTHCGWNSVLEAVTAGVTMLCWPLHSEQKMNKLLLVEEMRIAVEIVGWQQGLVNAGEVEEKVRLVMESEEGKELRARVAAHREEAAMAWKDGGSSRAAFARFLSDVDDNHLGPTAAAGQ